MKFKLSSKGRVMLSLMAGLLVVALKAPARADDEYAGDKGLSFGPRASYFKPKDGDGVWSGGAQLRFFPAKALALEGSIDYRREKFGDTRVDVYPVQVSLLAYILPLKPFSVFLLGGGGWYFTHVDNPDPASDSTHQRLGLHAGAGVELHLNNFWSIDGTYRYVWLEKLTSEDAALANKDFSDAGNQVTVGLNYHF